MGLLDSLYGASSGANQAVFGVADNLIGHPVAGLLNTFGADIKNRPITRFAQGFGLGLPAVNESQRRAQDIANMAANIGVGVVPGVGDVSGMHDDIKAVKESNYHPAAIMLAGAAALPFVRPLIRALPESVQDRLFQSGPSGRFGTRERGQLIIGKPLTKEAAQKLPIAQREHWHPIGDGKALKKPVNDFRRTVTEQSGMQPFRQVSPEDMQGGTLVAALGDRTDIGRDLLAVGDNPLETPVRLQGGHGYMREGDESIWASHAGPVKHLLNKVNPIIDQGGTPYLTYMPMGHGPVDFTTMMSDAMLEQMRGGEVSKTARNLFDRKLRKVRPEWKGLDSPESLAQLNSNGELRHAFMDTAQLEDFQKRGFPDLGETRHALTDPELLHLPNYHGGQSISIPTGQIVESPSVGHGTYNTQMAGNYFGGMEAPIPREVMFPDFFARRRAAGKPESGDDYSFYLAKPTQDANQEWVDGVMRYLASTNK